MFKKISALLLLVLVIFLIGLFISRSQSEVSTTFVSPTVSAFRQTLTKEKSTTTAPNPAPTMPMIGENLPEEDCWNKLSAQVQEGEFVRQNREAWQSLVGEWYYGPDGDALNTPETSAPGMFMQALLFSGQLYGQLLYESQEERALDLFEKVYALDPGNSAPLIYAAMIESKRGNEAEAQRLFAMAQNSNRFDTYIMTVSKSIFSQVRSSSDLIQAYAFWSHLPGPDYAAITKYLKARDSRIFAEQMTRAGLDEKNVLADIDWFALEYAVGFAIENKLNPNNKLPNYKEIVEKKNQQSPFSNEKMLAALKKKCDLSSLDEFTNEFRAYMNKK
ncbi:MAG: tetratricopeptide repeat protein [Bdellovibrionales bacterium]|nr:tetratricopeptide repeat protein [Bdellovibrionales bacterium]